MAGPKKNAVWTFGIALISQADTDIIQTSPTLAAGDVTVSIDGANYNNIGTLPTQIETTGTLPVALTAAEMNGDVIYVLFNDVAGDEWQDALVMINTETGTISEIDTNVDVVDATVWTYATRTLTQSAASVAAAVAGSAVEVYKDTYWSVSLTGLTTGVSITEAIVSVKESAGDSDDDSIMRISSLNGLERINKQAVADVTGVVAGDGTITVDGVAGTATIVLKTAAAKELDAEILAYDLKYVDGSSEEHEWSAPTIWTITDTVTGGV